MEPTVKSGDEILQWLGLNISDPKNEKYKKHFQEYETVVMRNTTELSFFKNIVLVLFPKEEYIEDVQKQTEEYYRMETEEYNRMETEEYSPLQRLSSKEHIRDLENEIDDMMEDTKQPQLFIVSEEYGTKKTEEYDGITIKRLCVNSQFSNSLWQWPVMFNCTKNKTILKFDFITFQESSIQDVRDNYIKADGDFKCLESILAFKYRTGHFYKFFYHCHRKEEFARFDETQTPCTLDYDCQAGLELKKKDTLTFKDVLKPKTNELEESKELEESQDFSPIPDPQRRRRDAFLELRQLYTPKTKEKRKTTFKRNKTS